MDRNTFSLRLNSAARLALQFAREMVQQTLPDEMVYLVYPNKSYDEQPRIGDEVTFPSDSLAGKYHGPWVANDVVNFLWRDGKVPQWIDIWVQSEDGLRTMMALYCCGRFTAMEELLYHRQGELPPFQAMGPCTPVFWESVEASGKIDLYWQNHLPKPKPPERTVDSAEPVFRSFLI